LMDCNVGQSEFSPEGMVSVTIIDSPIFGPPHTHQHGMKIRGHFIDGFKLWRSCYFGASNPMDDPALYLQCIQRLNALWIGSDLHDKVPLIVDCHGWVSGLGNHILKSIMVALAPSDLVEVQWADRPLFGSVEMDYLADAKDMFIQQKRSHFWNDPDYEPTLEADSASQDVQHSLIGSFVQQMTPSNEFTIDSSIKLKGSQKKWAKYLDDIADLNGIEPDSKWYRSADFTTFSERKNEKKRHSELQIFRRFMAAHVHYVESMAPNEQFNRDKEHNVDLRKKRMRNDREHRLLTMTSYFTQNAFENEPAVVLRERDCYKIPFDDVALLFLKEMESEDIGDGLILRALNGVIVALGMLEDGGKMEEDDGADIDGLEPPHKKRKIDGKGDGSLRVIDRDECSEMPQCVGLGIIRSIDAEQRVFYVITPVHPSQLNAVNLFIRGSTALPPQMMFNESIVEVPPYWKDSNLDNRMLACSS